jgi:hypothetical protein
MDKSKHTTVKFCDLEKASQSINDPFFTSFEEFDEDTYEVGFEYAKQIFNYGAKFKINSFCYL